MGPAFRQPGFWRYASKIIVQGSWKADLLAGDPGREGAGAIGPERPALDLAYRGGRHAMTIEVHRAEVQALTAAGAQLVDVLPHPQLEDQHLPGAINPPSG